MGGLNPNIILSIGQNAQQQPPPNLLGQYAQVQQIQANRMAMAAQQQNYQTAGLKQQQEQMALQQQQLTAKQQQDMVALIQQSGGDVRKAIQQGKAQGNQQALVLEKNQDEADGLVAKTKKEAEEAAKTHLETTQKGLDRIGSMADRVLTTKPELQGIAYQSVRLQAQQLQIPGADQLPPVWDESAKAALLNIQQGSITAADQIKQKLEAGRDVETGRHNQAQEAQAQASEASLEKYRGAEVQNMGAMRQLQAKSVGIAGMNAQTAREHLGLQQAEFQQNYGANGEGAGSAPLPGAMETIAQQVARGEKKLPRGMKGYNAIAMRAQAINPSLGDQTYSTVQSYLSSDGKASQQMGGITRVLGHMEQFQDDSKQVGNSMATSLGLHLPSNAGLRKTGDAISKELGRLVEQQAITESDKKTWIAGLDSGVKATRDATLESMRKILGSQFEVNFQNYTKATGQPLPVDKMFDKDTRQRLQKFYPELVSGAVAGTAASPGVTSAPGVPNVGAMFNGEKVLKVTRVK